MSKASCHFIKFTHRLITCRFNRSIIAFIFIKICIDTGYVIATRILSGTFQSTLRAIDSVPDGISVKAAMDALGIRKADVFGVSMGGMIAQHLAIDYPEAVEKLVLAVTCPRSNPILQSSVEEWMAAAKAGDHTAFMDSNVRLIYSGNYYRKNKWLIPIMGRLTKPASYARFFIQAQACLTHDAYASLSAIASPTLVIGGQQDKALGWEASRELAEQIPDAQLHLYPQWGHGVYEEETGLNALVLQFLTGGPDHAD